MNNKRKLIAADVGASHVKLAWFNDKGKIFTKKFPTTISRYGGGEIDCHSKLMINEADPDGTQYLVSKQVVDFGLDTNSGFSKTLANAALLQACLGEVANNGDNIEVSLTKPLDVLMDKKQDGFFKKSHEKEKKILQKFQRARFSDAAQTSKKVSIKPVRVTPEGVAAVCHQLLNIDGTYKDSLCKEKVTGFLDIGNATIQLGVMQGVRLIDKKFTSSINGAYLTKQILRRASKAGCGLKLAEIYQHFGGANHNEMVAKNAKLSIYDFLDILQSDGFSERFFEPYSSSLDGIIITGGLAKILGKDFFVELFDTDDIAIGTQFDNAIGALKVLVGSSKKGAR